MSGEPELEFANNQIEGHLEFIELTLNKVRRGLLTVSVSINRNGNFSSQISI